MQAEPSPRRRFLDGVRVGTGLAAASFVLALTFGAAAQEQGWSVPATIVASVVIFSGSAQFALLAALAGGGATLPAIAAALLINGRFLPMGLALGPSLTGGRMRRALQGQAVVDASFVAAHTGHGRFDRYRLFGATVPQWPAWVAGTAIGAFAAPPGDLVHDLGLDVAFPAFFVLLLIGELRSARSGYLSAAVGAGVAALLLWWAPAGVALLAATVGALLGLRARPLSETSDQS
ncbi:AzlC family ABC transporter permease [Symbioplanes lichenis]|uniref:AzlC family ABC transporter permease n=1 Tax=Symbioplanes lichenis TaxID=1629072 RepID=UPI002738E3DD|nr:AzlC family ABC transporter permease [Actinoplanes lichenis]